MNYHSISDNLWTDSGFRSVSANAKLVVLALLTSPLCNFTGIFFATSGMIAEFAGLKPEQTNNALSEIEGIGFIIRCQDHVIIKNYLLHNKFNKHTHSVRLVRDMNALPMPVFATAMQIDCVSEIYNAACEAQGIQRRVYESGVCYTDTKERVQKQVKTAKEPTPESEQIQRLRGYVDAIYAEFPKAKNKPSLSTDEYQKLIDKWGDKLVTMQKVYYEWLSTYDKKRTHSDFGTLIKGGWVLNRVDETGNQEQPENNLIRHF